MEPDEQLTVGEEQMLAVTSALVGAVFRQVRREFGTLPDRLTADPVMAGRVRAECSASIVRVHTALMAAAELVEHKGAGHVAN